MPYYFHICEKDLITMKQFLNWLTQTISDHASESNEISFIKIHTHTKINQLKWTSKTAIRIGINLTVTFLEDIIV